MKKNIGILTLVLILVTVFFGTQQFNQETQNRVDYLHNYQDKKVNYQYLDVLNGEFSESKVTFFSDLDELGEKYKVSIYAVATSVSPATGNPISLNYVSSTDTFLKDSVLIEGGEFTNSNNFLYSSISTDANQKISNIFSPFEFNLQNIRSKQEFGGPYYFKPQVMGDNESIDKLLNEFQTMYPKFDYVRYEKPIYLEAYYNPNLYLKEMFMICCLLTLMLSSTLFSKLREISLRKMEGHSTYTIYFEYYEKYFLIFSIIGYLILNLFSYIIYPKSHLSSSVLAGCMNEQYIRICIIQQIVSIALYILISFSPVTVSIKGKNSLKELQIVAYTMKIGICLLMIPSMFMGYKALLDTVVIVKNHNISKNQLENLYTFSGNYYSSYFNYEDRELDARVNMIANEFKANNDLFTFIGAYVESALNHSQLLPFNRVDKEYLLQQQLIAEDDKRLSQAIILIRSDSKIDEDTINLYKESIERSTETEVSILKYNKNLITYRTRELLYSALIGDEILVYEPTSKWAQRVNGAMFQYVGYNVQEYVDSVFIKHGFEPAFMIEKLNANYESLYRYRLNWNSKTILPLLTMVIAYLLITKLLIEIDLAANSKKYFMRKIEGYFGVSTVSYILKIGSPILISFILLRLCGRIYLTQSSYAILLSVCVFEFIIYMVYQILYRNLMKR